MCSESRKAAGLSSLPLSSGFYSRFEYDVFLSFRGKDTRNNFAGLFYHILDIRGIRTYFDEDGLHRGGRIEEILEAITRSKIYVPIFSQHFAESQWCLREVAKMVECHKVGGQERLIIPVFFDIDPSDVRHQTGPFKTAFKKHDKEWRDEADRWKKALQYAGGIAGYDLCNRYHGNQRELVEDISKTIQNILTTSSPVPEEEFHVGLKLRLGDMKSRLNFEVKKALIIGIHGLGGLGKTTLAKATYHRWRHLFDASSFLENVREVSKSRGLVPLQQQLIQDISRGRNKKEIHKLAQGTKMIEYMLRGKRVLLVLDDVDDQKQFEALAGSITRYHPKSRIIITTRHEHILEVAGLQEEAIYRLPELDEEESSHLFSHHAFKGNKTQGRYIHLAKEVVSISNGLPLVLEVFGSLFRTSNTIEGWEKLLSELKLRQNNEIHERLRTCYDSLNNNERLILLDIACLLVGKDAEDAVYTWEDHKLSPIQAIRSLQNRSLVKIIDGKFEMHDQTRDMGREIVMRESHLVPGRYSRVWYEGDVVEALTKSQANMIEGIILNFREGSKTTVSTEAFGLMSRLRILHITSATFGGCDFMHFPADLKWLEWKGCPLETLPIETRFKSIVVLNLSGSSITQLWSESTTGSSSKSTKELFECLKVLDLSCCHRLAATPDFTMAPNLEKLILDQCINLEKVDDSIGSLKKLVFLSMRGCVCLEKLPDEIYELSNQLLVFNHEGCSGLAEQILKYLRLATTELDHDEAIPTLLPSEVPILWKIKTGLRQSWKRGTSEEESWKTLDRRERNINTLFLLTENLEKLLYRLSEKKKKLWE